MTACKPVDGEIQQFEHYLRWFPAMPKPNTSYPQEAVVAKTATMSADEIKRHMSLQRACVVTLGCLWLLAFASGCSRNSKNCSAYDGVEFTHEVTDGESANWAP